MSQIKLPTSTQNQTASRGYITYKVKPLATLVEMDTITNNASIYFDFAAPFKTNTESTVVYMPVNTWTGAQDRSWENAQNWSKHVVPDHNARVIIPANVPHFPVLNSNVTCFSLYVDPAASLTIGAGKKLKLTGK